MKTPLDSNWYKQFILPLLSAAVWLQGGVQGSAATTYYWDALTGDNTVESGSGNWNTTDTTWTTSTTSVNNVAWANGTGNVASFGGTSGTSGAYLINVATSGTLQGITFTSSGYKLTAATSTTMTLGIGATGQNGVSAGGITLSNNASAIIGDGITLTAGTAGSLPFTVQGSGTLTVASSSASAPATLKSLLNNNFNIVGGATVVVGTNGQLLCTAYTTGTGSMVIGNSTSNATLTVDGGLVSTFTNFVVGNAAASGISTVNLVSGTIAGTSGTGILRFGTSSVSTSGTGILNLNGGTLAIGGIGILATGTGSAAYFVNLNGGTVQATQSNANFLNSYSQITAKVLSGGAIFDTAGYNITVSQALISGTAGDGGLTKKGTGTLTLAGANTYTGATTVKSGSLVVGASGNISSTVVLGGSGGLSGTLDVSLKGSSYSLANLSGQGAMIGAASSTITATGAVAPGINVGELDVSTNFTLAGTAATAMEISGNGGVKGTDSDYLNVSGILTYGGSLVISSYNNYDLSQAGTYTLFNFTTSSGDFSSVTVDGVALTKLGEVWSNSSSAYSFDESTGVLSVTAVPEPSTYAILVSGLGMLGLLRRKSRA